MWLLQQPFSVFDYVHGYQEDKIFQCIALVPTIKFNQFSQKSIQNINSIDNGLSIEDVKVNDPDNPVSLIDCKLIKYVI